MLLLCMVKVFKIESYKYVRNYNLCVNSKQTNVYSSAPAEIITDGDSLSYEVNFTTDFTPMLHIKFTVRI